MPSSFEVCDLKSSHGPVVWLGEVREKDAELLKRVEPRLQFPLPRALIGVFLLEKRVLVE